MTNTKLTLTKLVSAAALLVGCTAAHAQSEIKVVLDGEVRVTDPIATQAYITRTFAYLVYDVLIAMDSKGGYKPQMLQSFESSADRMSYTFKLRPGLKWSDGTPVTARDCVASIKRWGSRDSNGKQLMSHTKSLSAVDDQTFRLDLAKPFGWVIESLGKPSSNVPVMMPERLASLPASRAVPDVVGSGPWTFKKSEWVPGSKMVFEKNPHYLPRNEPADGFAGGKRALLDRIEFIVMPDPATKVAALRAGEVDYVQSIPFDFMKSLEGNKNVSLLKVPPLGAYMAGAVMNTTQPPFNNPKIRRALEAAIVQKDVLAALGAPPGYATECLSIFMCGTTYESNAGATEARQTGVERARQLLKEAGYKGEKVLVLHATDVYLIHLISTVMEDLMRRAGFNVEAAPMDWPLIAKRRYSKEPVDKGGWSLMPARFAGFDQAHPLTNYATGFNCHADSFTGWYCDEQLKPLMDKFNLSNDIEVRKRLAGEMQERVYAVGNFVSGGQFTAADGHRSNLKGVLSVGIPVFWNIQK